VLRVPGLHPLGQRRRHASTAAEIANDWYAGERLKAEPAEDEYGQPQRQNRRGDAPGDGQTAAASTCGIGEDLVQGGGVVRLWHGSGTPACTHNAHERRWF
jgi:hypothetical protein